uniref:NADH dehydrogenase [ubiquinone] 1 beta subcomplex subunit 9 n=1 Tax=Romanomermis culicivorax TaxID=13658 RepID=A0A915IN70_ROMCU
MRSRFDAHKDEKDSRKSKLLLMEGVKELWVNRQDEPLIHMGQPPSFAYGRDPKQRDVALDIEWTHQERYQYPYYFEKRDNRKKEVLEQWYKITGSWTRPFDKKNVRGD